MGDFDRVLGVIRGPDGEAFLRGMRSVYRGELSDTSQAESLGLTKGSELTTTGYLVGNVAKEYINWVDAGRELPASRPPEALLAGREVVDLGCSFGRWLWYFERHARAAIGVERQPEYIALAEVLAFREGFSTPRIIEGSIDELDLLLEPASATLAFSRIVWNHLEIRAALAKTAAVLRKDGVLWLEVETFAFAWRSLFTERRVVSRIRAAFGVVNSGVCELTGRQLALRRKGRMHDVHRPAHPSQRWWLRAIADAGFSGVRCVAEARHSMVFMGTRP